MKMSQIASSSSDVHVQSNPPNRIRNDLLRQSDLSIMIVTAQS